MAALKVGIIGIGSFGTRVGVRLLRSGYPDLMVYDTHEQTPRVFTGTHGGLSLGSPAMMGQMCDVIITALPSAREMRDTFFGWEGLAGEFPGGVVLDVGLTDPIETVAMAGELAAHNIQLVDAPGFGTPQNAREGTLTMIVGGDEAAVERCQPILDALATRVIRAGAAGSAQAAGAIADYMRAARLLAASEAIRLGAGFGFEAGNLLEVCDALGGADLPGLMERELVSGRYKSGMQIGLLRANVELTARLAQAVGAKSPLLETTRESLQKAEEALGYSNDQTALIKWLEVLSRPPEEDSEAAAAPETKTGPA